MGLGLRACHSGGSIQLEIAADGNGLDSEAILSKARERGLIFENGDARPEAPHTEGV